MEGQLNPNSKEFNEQVKAIIAATMKSLYLKYNSVANDEKYLRTYANLVRNLYEEFMEVGFSDDQAFELVKLVVSFCPLVG